MKHKTVPFVCLRVAHPTIIGKTIPLRRTLGTPEEEARLKLLGEKAKSAGKHLRKIFNGEITSDQA